MRLPLNDLLRVKTTGVYVNDIASFIERETGARRSGDDEPQRADSFRRFFGGTAHIQSGKRLFDIAPRASWC